MMDDASREEHDEQVLFACGARDLERVPRGHDAPIVGNRMNRRMPPDARRQDARGLGCSPDDLPHLYRRSSDASRQHRRSRLACRHDVHRSCRAHGRHDVRRRHRVAYEPPGVHGGEPSAHDGE
jgi:hypothetical protein